MLSRLAAPKHSFVGGVLLLCLLAALVSGCAPVHKAVPSPAPTSPATAAPGTLRIGVLPITDTVPFYVAEAQGYYQQQGLKVELVPASSAAERDQLMIAGRIDGEVSDLIAVALFDADQPRLTIVRKARQAVAGSPQLYILAPKASTIRSVSELAGVEVAVSQNSLIQYVTERLLQLEGVPKDQIRTTNVPQIALRLQLLDQGQVKAATLPDPLGSLALMEGARLLIDDSKHPEISQSVIAFSSQVVRERPQDVRAFLAAYEKALQDIRSHPEQFHDLLVEKGRVPDALKGHYTFPVFPDPSVPSRSQWEDATDWLVSKGLLRAPVAYETAVDDQFVR
jgi:NitT/TauT family transport system substrate-binding protein